MSEETTVKGIGSQLVLYSPQKMDSNVLQGVLALVTTTEQQVITVNTSAAL